MLAGGYGALLNLLGLCLMAFDKCRARRGGHRIRERTLFLVAALGGSIGCWAGMHLFRHKTKHRAFVVGIPAILAVSFFWLDGRRRKSQTDCKFSINDFRVCCAG